MSIVLGIDVGDVRVGLALSDEQRKVATPYKTVQKSQGNAEKEILTLIEQRGIDTLVVGLPLNAKGEKTEQCQKVEAFCLRLQKRASITIHFVDEHLTSEAAKERLGLSGAKAQAAHKKGLIDSVAASIILQEYLDSIR
ncbi:MAG: Holliday junction resolvase RuvX [Deltaproteobacteria bacterium]|nr:Holliday junction resolvase RuvX [Deltaproteobacteria bacterium]